LQLPKGVKDFPPEEKIARDKLIALLTSLFERFGFNPLETPVFERFDMLSAKYAGGAEILKETLHLPRSREAGARLALRFDRALRALRRDESQPEDAVQALRYRQGFS
jgi:histidyl-tRNA synthetase